MELISLRYDRDFTPYWRLQLPFLCHRSLIFSFIITCMLKIFTIAGAELGGTKARVRMGMLHQALWSVGLILSVPVANSTHTRWSLEMANTGIILPVAIALWSVSAPWHHYKYFIFFILYIQAEFDAKVIRGIGIMQWPTRIYRKIYNVSRTLVNNKSLDHSDVVGVLPVGATPTSSSFAT